MTRTSTAGRTANRGARRWGALGLLATGLGVASLFVTGLFVGGPVLASDVEVDESQVYYGRASAYKKAGEIDCNEVFRAIPEYQKIREEGLKEGVRYDFLLLRANEKFKKALKRADKRKGYDLIVEQGAITGSEDKIPDITQVVIDLLPN